MLRQDELIREATQVAVPEGFAARIQLNQSLQSQSRRPTQKYWLGLAASFLLAVALAPAIMQKTFYEPYDTHLVSHVSHHDVLTGATPAPLSDRNQVRQVLASVNTAMPENSQNIIYAANCIVDGEVMAHLLMKNGDQHYVVFLIPQQTLLERSFVRDAWSGQVAKLDNRSIAILNQDGRNLELAAQMFSEQFKELLSSGQTI